MQGLPRLGRAVTTRLLRGSCSLVSTFPAAPTRGALPFAATPDNSFPANRSVITHDIHLQCEQRMHSARVLSFMGVCCLAAGAARMMRTTDVRRCAVQFRRTHSSGAQFRTGESQARSVSAARCRHRPQPPRRRRSPLRRCGVACSLRNVRRNIVKLNHPAIR